jgi:hypothetical protein
MGSLLDQYWRRYLGHTDTDSNRRSTSDPHGDVDSQTIDERSNDNDDDPDGYTGSTTVLCRNVITHKGRGYRRQKVRCRHETKSVTLWVFEESVCSGGVSFSRPDLVVRTALHLLLPSWHGLVSVKKTSTD